MKMRTEAAVLGLVSMQKTGTNLKCQNLSGGCSTCRLNLFFIVATCENDSILGISLRKCIKICTTTSCGQQTPPHIIGSPSTPGNYTLSHPIPPFPMQTSARPHSLPLTHPTHLRILFPPLPRQTRQLSPDPSSRAPAPAGRRR